MADIVDRETRSRMMAGIKSKNTSPEMLVRKYLHKEGFRYRLHNNKLPGSPDVVLPKWKTVIFVHGCFWHRHDKCKYTTMPGTNQEKWDLKFRQNTERDSQNIAAMVHAGWRVIVLWECGLRAVHRGKLSLDWLPRCIRSPQTKRGVVVWPII